ncbi:MAG: ImmA/IrrE family metallo-endopeptidase [Bacteroidales bacterium]|nr:ImmA/IrrE family metallo-endopeptidase [Bacteroidales bacterium]
MTNQARRGLVEKQVVDFRNKYGLSATEPVLVKSLLLRLGVLTLYRPLSDGFSGMSLKDLKGNRFMLVNSNDPIGRQHFTIGHELYHLFVEENPQPHICQLGGKKDESEKCADLFASILLMPEAAILQMMPDEEVANDRVSMATVLRLEHYFSVSRTALLNRLESIGRIAKKDKEALQSVPVKESAQEMGYDTALYNKGNAGLIIGELGAKAKRLFEEGRISEGHYIEVLNKLN